VLATLLLAAWLVPPPPAAATEVLDELREIVEKSRRERAADRWLQNALEDLLAKYDSPWRREILFEDFSDGDFTRNPTWRVVRGDFQVLRGQGLYSSSDGVAADQRGDTATGGAGDATQALSGLIVGALLDQALGPSNQGSTTDRPMTRGGGPAEIRLDAGVSNSFALDIDFRQSGSNGAAFEVALLQSEAGQYGYRLRIQSGRRGFVELQRIRAGRGSVVASQDLDTDYADGRLHALRWSHRPDGELLVSVDGRPLLQLRERAFRDAYPWLHLGNDLGDLTVRSVRISGT
jgi:hypothetical protein